LRADRDGPAAFQKFGGTSLGSIEAESRPWPGALPPKPRAGLRPADCPRLGDGPHHDELTGLRHRHPCRSTPARSSTCCCAHRRSSVSIALLAMASRPGCAVSNDGTQVGLSPSRPTAAPASLKSARSAQENWLARMAASWSFGSRLSRAPAAAVAGTPEITTLGRGGSDTSPGPGGGDGAEACEIYTDVPGCSATDSPPGGRGPADGRRSGVQRDVKLASSAGGRFSIPAPWRSPSSATTACPLDVLRLQKLRVRPPAPAYLTSGRPRPISGISGGSGTGKPVDWG